MRAGQIGDVAIKLPLPPGCLPTLWQNDERYQHSYLSLFPATILPADAGYKDEQGYLWIMSRTDDVINVAGHRLSTGIIEEVLAAHPNVAECAVVGVADEIKGEVPMGFVVLKAGVTRSRMKFCRVDPDGPRPDRPGGLFQSGDGRSAAAQDSFGQNFTWHDQENCRRRGLIAFRPPSTTQRSSTRSRRIWRRSATRARRPPAEPSAISGGATL